MGYSASERNVHYLLAALEGILEARPPWSSQPLGRPHPCLWHLPTVEGKPRPETVT